MVNEGGSIEVDGRGTLMAKRSSILNRNRNPGATQADAEAYFRRYMGVTNFIWLDGTPGLEITDDHIGKPLMLLCCCYAIDDGSDHSIPSQTVRHDSPMVTLL